MTVEKWEYLAEFVWAEADLQGVREYLQQRFHDFKPAGYSPETMIPHLNSRGEAGWELVHIEPVAKVGENRDVGFASNVAGGAIWSHTYFCVFKRRKVE